MGRLLLFVAKFGTAFSISGCDKRIPLPRHSRFGIHFLLHVMFSSDVLLRISKEVGAPVSRVETTIKLLEDGATVPFIARYRKEATGNLDEVKTRDMDERRHYYSDLEARRATVLASIEKQGK